MSIQTALFEPPAPIVWPATAWPLGVEAKARGAVFTQQSVVNFMLDLLGYTPDKPLYQLRLLEPSFGGGRFVLTAVGRLLAAWRNSDGGVDDSMLDNAIRAVELDEGCFGVFRGELTQTLLDEGLPELSAERLAKAWLLHGDFLTCEIPGSFDAVVGNPPYVRQELVLPALLAQYRSMYSTMVGRADLYVPFFERSLSLLATGGQLSFICADAWTKNEYGRELRRLVTNGFSLRTYVDMYGVDAFESEVGAYPSITVIAKQSLGPVCVAKAASADAATLEVLKQSLDRPAQACDAVGVLPPMPSGPGPWLLRVDRRHDALREMEARHGTLEDVGCRVGIGVATGADKVFLSPLADLDVEDDRKLPLAVNRDIVAGELTWHGMGVVNPWADDGSLVDISIYPKLARYLAPHYDQLAIRHTARGDVARKWYRTIDRITPGLTWEPKLLVPDIRGDGSAIAYDSGTVYPHHNLYFITSTMWDLRALQAVLRSGIAHLFVDAYAVKIGGGYLRFQAQYLRRIRLPHWQEVAPEDRDLLMLAGVAGEVVSHEVLERVYRLDKGMLAALEQVV